MTNQQGAPEAPRPIQRYKIGYHSDEWGVRSSTPGGIKDQAGPWVRYEDHAAELLRLHAENEALQQGYDAARMEIDGLRDRVQELGAMLRENCNRRIVELEAQLDAIGAGGVEPLRRRECLHQISEPANASVPPGFALVPVRPTRAMDDVLNEEGWQWDDLLAAAEAIEEQHPDDAAVDTLAALMKAKLAKQRARGYGGWDTPECTQQRLSDMLRGHVDKGDPVDVANFCAFLAARGEGIAQAAPAAVAGPDGWKLAPVEPTQAMLRKVDGLTCIDFTALGEEGAFTNDELRAIYRAFLDASPQQPVPAAQGDAEDTARLDWLTFNISGKALRDIGVVWSEHGDARRAIDAARSQDKQGANHD